MISIPFYLDCNNRNNGAVTFSLIYSFKGIDYEVSIFCLHPSEQKRLSLNCNMVIGGGQGFSGTLLPIKNSAPTIILEIECEEGGTILRSNTTNKYINYALGNFELPQRDSKESEERMLETKAMIEKLDIERLQL